MELFKVNKELYIANCNRDVRYIVNQGGTGSGKTYCIMQRLIALSMEQVGIIITVAGQDLPNLKVGAIRDTLHIIGGNSYLSGWFEHNKSDNTFTGKNSSIIEFKSYADEQDAKSGKRDYLFVNEANGMQFSVFWQLQIRTRDQVFIDYNPSARFWVHDNIIGGSDCALVISDHRGNLFLPEDMHREIEGISDPELWKVYARGMTGKLTGLVFPTFNIIDAAQYPTDAETKMRALGLDFGFSQDYCALEEVRLAHGQLWIDERIYSRGYTNTDIVEECRRQGITRRDLIIADQAEPKSIQELKNAGLWVLPCTKGRDSITFGIDLMKRYTINVTRRSTGIINELKQYKWQVDRDGNPTNQPIDRYNHGIDSCRYAITYMKGQERHRPGSVRTHIIKLY